MMLPERLGHLPDNKRRELERVARILFDEFEAAQKGKQSEKKKGGRILKLILFGSYARGDWVEDHKSGYSSDYDVLVVVDKETFVDPHDYWDPAAEHFLRELTVTKHLTTPVNFIVHCLADLNDQLAHGRPFFVDIARDGIVVFLKVGGPLMVIALVVGLIVSLVQALTQIQEQTLVFVPKIVAVFAALLLFLPFMGDALAGYMGRVAARIATGG